MEVARQYVSRFTTIAEGTLADELRRKVGRSERGIRIIRLAIMTLATVTMPVVLRTPGTNAALAYGTLAAAWAFCLYLTFRSSYVVLPSAEAGEQRGWRVNLISILDGIFVALVIVATGGVESPYYVAWFTGALSAAFRHRVVGSLAVTGYYSLLYILSASPQNLNVTQWNEVAIRIGFLFIMGGLASFTAAFSTAQAVGSAVMTERLRMLDQTKAELEREVLARTEELAQTNESLRLEIAEHQRTMTELRMAKQAAEIASSAKSSFLANMSHEIRTPLTALLGFVDLLGEPSLPEEARRMGTAAIKRNGHLLVKLVGDILDLSKIESGRLELEMLPVDIAALLSEVATLLGREAEKKNLQLVCEVASGMPDLVMTDPTKLRQVLINLIGNAIKFTDQGHVAVFATGFRDPHRPQRAHIAITVSDTGRGIAEDKQEQLFHPFSQVESSTAREYGGTGLGLALSRSLAEAFGGSLTLEESTPGRGSTFLLTMPAEIAEAAVKADLPPTPVVDGGVSAQLAGARVLLVEDTSDLQVLMSLVLIQEGAEVEFAENGQEAVEKVQKGHYDLVLMDIQMPIMDGYTATGKLRELGFTMPIIALTAHALKEERERCFKAGCSGFLSKPINHDKLISIVREELGRDASDVARGTGTTPA